MPTCLHRVQPLIWSTGQFIQSYTCPASPGPIWAAPPELLALLAPLVTREELPQPCQAPNPAHPIPCVLPSQLFSPAPSFPCCQTKHLPAASTRLGWHGQGHQAEVSGSKKPHSKAWDAQSDPSLDVAAFVILHPQQRFVSPTVLRGKHPTHFSSLSQHLRKSLS